MKLKLLFFIILSFLFSFSALSADKGYIHVNYGITAHSVGHTHVYSYPGGTSTTTVDEEDQGFMVSGGFLIGSNWGVDVMYHDLGNTSIKGDANDIFQLKFFDPGNLFQNIHKHYCDLLLNHSLI